MQPDQPQMEILPCRGCTRDCPDIGVCEHRPWRCAPGAWPEGKERESAKTPQS